jgi:two-component system OmpR family response regulator
MDMETSKDILAVDDNDTILSLIAEVARLNGYQLRTAHSAKEFFDAYQAKTPALMMIDIVMPDMDGLEMIQKLAAADCRVPLVIMSGYDYIDDQGIRLLTKRLNLVKFLRKPFEVDELMELFTDTLQAAH